VSSFNIQLLGSIYNCVEIERNSAILAEGAFVCGAGHRLGFVKSHNITVVLLLLRVWGNRCATLEQETFSQAGNVADFSSRVGCRGFPVKRFRCAKTNRTGYSLA
jgi:hypothetical protein